MFRILDKHQLTPNTDLIVIDAPEIARKAAPGQFVILRKDDRSERIPLTIADFDRDRGTVSVIFQNVGKSTQALGEMHSGEQLRNLVGPLGKASDIDICGRVLLVASGAGIAPIYPIARALYETNNYVTVIMGARSADFVYWEEKLNAVCDEFYLCTDDGSKGRKGSVTQLLREALQAPWLTGRIWANGPAVLMKSCSEMAKAYHTPILVGLDSIMVDGTGMCGACRVDVGGATRFVCVDGPEFDGAAVNWEILLSRKMARPEDKPALQPWSQKQPTSHICRLDEALLRQEASQVAQPAFAAAD